MEKSWERIPESWVPVLTLLDTIYSSVWPRMPLLVEKIPKKICYFLALLEKLFWISIVLFNTFYFQKKNVIFLVVMQGLWHLKWLNWGSISHAYREAHNYTWADTDVHTHTYVQIGIHVKTRSPYKHHEHKFHVSAPYTGLRWERHVSFRAKSCCAWGLTICRAMIKTSLFNYHPRHSCRIMEQCFYKTKYCVSYLPTGKGMPSAQTMSYLIAHFYGA